MELQTKVDIARAPFEIGPCEDVLLVGSCFADGIGQRFREEGFPVTVNPYGTMYNPASVLHTIERYQGAPRIAFITLGTNHIYIEKETGDIVDNCEKRPQALFLERQLGVSQCADYLRRAVDVLRRRHPEVRVVFTVSPIRYRKYGYHESQLSKATLLLAVQEVLDRLSSADAPGARAAYFPAYEIMMDELRDYRFYAPDMLHPSQQTVDYIWERLVDYCFSADAKAYLEEWRPLKQALAHRPFRPEAPEYRALMDKTMLKVAELRQKYPTFAL